MHAESTQVVVMTRHVTPARRKQAWHAIQLLDISRPQTVGIGPSSAETMIPWLKTDHWGPKNPWLLSARFKDESWIHCIASNANLLSVERVARNEKLQVLVAWFDPKENRSHARFHKRGGLAAELAAAGKGDVPLQDVSFKSSAYPKTFLKRCKTVRQAVDGFFAALDAQPRDLTVIEAKGSLELQDSQGRATHAGELDELAIQYYAPLTSTENPAAARLQSAIESGDVKAARQAIADGASLEFLADLQASPLMIAFDDRYPGDWRGVAKLLVEAGAPIDGYDWEDPPICFAINPLGKDREGSIIKSVQTILSLGADINSPARGLNKGSTPLHLAILNSFPEVAHFLINQGASLDARDARGLTPLELAESMAENDSDIESAIGTDDALGAEEGARRMSPLEYFATKLGGTRKEQAKRRARVVKMLRDGFSRGNRG